MRDHVTLSGPAAVALHDVMRAYAKQQGWAWFVRPWNLNLWGFRVRGRLGAWDDVLAVFYADERRELYAHLARGTTDPGREGTATRSDGVAVLPDGSYDKLWRLGVHKRGTPSEHAAFVQARPVTVGRDAVVDGVSVGTGKSAAHGINSHQPWTDGLVEVGSASLGCQVTWSKAAHRIRYALARKQVAAGLGDLYSYHLTSDPLLVDRVSRALT